MEPSQIAREQQLETALHHLLASIDLFTDCMDNRIDRAPLEPYIETAERLLAAAWIPDDGNPAPANPGLHPKHFVSTWTELPEPISQPSERKAA